MPAAVNINHADPQLYEHLGIIIDTFEKVALEGEGREGFLVSAAGPLAAMDSILESADDALGSTPDVPDERPAELGISAQDENGDGIPEVRINASVNLEADLEDIFGDGSLVANYIQECIGCDLRLQFDWQLQPIDLLGPIASLLSDINLALDSFERQMDPFQTLDTLCDMLNNLNILCLPDLAAIMLSLRLLLKNYLTSAFELRLDWTVVVGPLLKIILDGVNRLIRQISGVFAAPLDCAVGALTTLENIEREINQSLLTASAVGTRIEERAAQVTGVVDTIDDGVPGISFEDVEEADGENIDAYVNWRDVLVNDGRVAGRNRISWEDAAVDEEGEQVPTFPSGIVFDHDVRLPVAMRDPRFGEATWTTKLILAIKEAQRYMKNLVRRITGTIGSLQSLVGGGLTVQLGNLGMILFVRDMIALVTMIIQLFRQNPGVTDWCQFIQDNPESLRPYLANFTRNRVSFETDQDRISLFIGPNRVGEIKTCITKRSGSAQDALLQQWVSQLQGRRN